MPIRNCSFRRIDSFSPPRPILPIKIINPDNHKFFKTWGIIDTGADECAISANVAEILGHNLSKGKLKPIETASGISNAFSHITTIEVFHPDDNILIYKFENILVDFMDGLPHVLLGVDNFLNKFILEINYPSQVFSLHK